MSVTEDFSTPTGRHRYLVRHVDGQPQPPVHQQEFVVPPDDEDETTSGSDEDRLEWRDVPTVVDTDQATIA